MAIVGENRLFTTIRCAGDEEWLAQRTKGVGGSDVAAIMGLSPWKTPAQVWLEKTGRVEPEDISAHPYVQFGNIMEPVVGRLFAERHPDFRVRRVNAICQSVERPWAQASLDFEVNDGTSWGVLEIKTARSAKDWADGVPYHYLTQVVHYLDVTGRAYAYVAVFFRDSCEFAEYRVERDEEDIEAVRSAVDDFWLNYVQADVMPAVVGTQGEASSLARYWGSGGDDLVEAGADADELVAAYQDAAERERVAKADKTAASTRLIELIGGHKGLTTDTSRVTWVRASTRSFDRKRFEAEHPDLYEQYLRTSVTNRGLRIKDL